MPGKPPHNPYSPDAFTYSSALNRMDQNPLQVIVGDISRMLNVLTNLNKHRKVAKMRITQLEERVAKVEAEIASVNPNVDGMRLNKLR